MTPCPERSSDFDQLLTTGRCCIEMDAHLSQCKVCQAALEADQRLPALLAKLGREMMEYPQ